MTHEELKLEAKEWARKHDVPYPSKGDFYHDRCYGDDCLFDAQVAAYLSGHSAAHRWTPVGESLPKEYVPVLVSYIQKVGGVEKRREDVTVYSKLCQWHLEHPAVKQVTHWQHLPPSPQKEEGGE